jgi:acetyl/propionyl-CoA carboxylase alpha subunit
MSEAATAFARAIGYRSLGTAEFLLDGRDFYFLELNGRIQVEHPVTEEALGLDLVALQLAVARGEELFDPSAVFRRHAVEVRLYAEDPVDFLPQAGKIERLRLPGSIRVDAGVAQGDEVGVAYDPMVAKLIATGADRREALDRLAAALDETVVEGVVTNLPFLRWLVSHPVVREGSATTAFLTEYPPLSSAPAHLPTGPWAEPWRLNLPLPAPASAPDPDAPALDHAHTGDQSTLSAPMPGTVIRVAVDEGDRVEPRQTLVVLEAMKMETPIVAPYEAVVRAIHVAEGDRVVGGATLVELEN